MNFPRDLSVCKLDVVAAFEGLSKLEKLYAYHIARASWEVKHSYCLVPIHRSLSRAFCL
jgi:hypothetical protein